MNKERARLAHLTTKVQFRFAAIDKATTNEQASPKDNILTDDDIFKYSVAVTYLLARRSGKFAGPASTWTTK